MHTFLWEPLSETMGLLGWCLSTLRVFAFPNTKTRFQYKPYEASLFEIILLISKPS